jgi:hypothetical protein
MSTTFVPPLRPLKTEIDLQTLTEEIYEQMRIAQGDEDKAGSIDDACYYEGWVDALASVIAALTVEPEEEKE